MSDKPSWGDRMWMLASGKGSLIFTEIELIGNI